MLTIMLIDPIRAYITLYWMYQANSKSKSALFRKIWFLHEFIIWKNWIFKRSCQSLLPGLLPVRQGDKKLPIMALLGSGKGRHRKSSSRNWKGSICYRFRFPGLVDIWKRFCVLSATLQKGMVVGITKPPPTEGAWSTLLYSCLSQT